MRSKSLFVFFDGSIYTTRLIEGQGSLQEVTFDVSTNDIAAAVYITFDISGLRLQAIDYFGNPIKQKGAVNILY